MAGESVDSELSGGDAGHTQVLETAHPHLSNEDAVADILRQAMQPAKQPETAADPPPPAEKWDLKSVAERLQTDPAELYNQLKVSLGDEELTVGQLKDRLKPQKDLEADRDSLLKARGELEADRIAARRELDAMRSGDREAYERGRSEYLSREREQLLRAIPEWADPAIVTADRKRIGDLVREFGFPEGVLDQVEDHRLFRLLRAYERDRAELAGFRKAKAEAEKPKPKVAVQPKGGKPSTDAQRFGQLKAAVTTGRVGKVDAVASLLKGAGVK